MIELTATYYDGQSSKPHAVVLRVESGGPLRIEGLASPIEFALADVRIAPRLGNTPRSLSFPEGAKCETLDNDAVDALERLEGAAGVRGQSTVRAWIHRLESGWRWALASLALVVLIVVVGFQWGVPRLARSIAMQIPDEMTYDLGRGTLATLDRILFSPSQLSEDRRAELRVEFGRMAAKYPGLPLSLEFRHAGFPNAFALPDGTIVVTDGLVKLAQNDEQIMSVLAHEIGHVHHRHTLRMALESSSIALLATVTLGDASQIVGLLSAFPTLYAQAHYSRFHETEADTFALEYLDRSGIARHHFADILTLLQQDAGGQKKGVATYLSSHPPTEQRVQRFREPH